MLFKLYTLHCNEQAVVIVCTCILYNRIVCYIIDVMVVNCSKLSKYNMSIHVCSITCFHVFFCVKLKINSQYAGFVIDHISLVIYFIRMSSIIYWPMKC